jgi:hypothetical protein
LPKRFSADVYWPIAAISTLKISAVDRLHADLLVPKVVP